MHLFSKHYKLARNTVRFYSSDMRYKIVIVRHGETNFNKLNLYCGWYNADLSEKGFQQAKEAGKTLRKEGLEFDKAFTSVLKRANHTLDTILKEIGQTDIPIVKSWRLNERHYGALTGFNKQTMAEKYGEEQVKIWGTFDGLTPPMEKDHKHYNDIVNDKTYAYAPRKKQFPMCESIKLALERALPFWNYIIVPEIQAGERIIISGHSDILKAIVRHVGVQSKHLTNVSLPTALPFVLILGENMKPIKNRHSFYYLGEPREVIKTLAIVLKDDLNKQAD